MKKRVMPKPPDEEALDEGLELAVRFLSDHRILKAIDALAETGWGGSCPLRDRFAAHAMQSSVIMNVMGHAQRGPIPEDPYEALARASYRIADAMLAQRSKR